MSDDTPFRTLAVWWAPTAAQARLAGRFWVDRSGDSRFAYDSSWLADPAAPPLSFSLPKRARPFGRRECRPFFEGLLPEERQRDAIARRLGISPGNDFRLLEALGGDVAGALVLLPEQLDGQEAAGQDARDRYLRPTGGSGNERPRPLEDAELAALIDGLPARPMMAGEAGLRLSLAGAQSKLPVVFCDGRVALPAAGQATTHILKPAMSGVPATVENEAFAMRLAALAGLTVAAAEPRVVRDGKGGRRAYLLVERYDRAVEPDGSHSRLHQEDFCQALGILTQRKYASDGGPTFAGCFDLIRRACSRPAVDAMRMLDAALYQLVVGNADAHGKNYSLVYRPLGPGGDGPLAFAPALAARPMGAAPPGPPFIVELAPLYDLLTTVVYEELSPRLAMRVAGRATLEEMEARHWSRFAEEIGIAEAVVRRRAANLVRQVLRALPLAMEEIGRSRPAANEESLNPEAPNPEASDPEALDREALSRQAETIERRARRVAQILG